MVNFMQRGDEQKYAARSAKAFLVDSLNSSLLAMLEAGR